MMMLLQANLHRSVTASALLPQIMLEHNSEVAIISEQHSKLQSGRWFEDTSGTAAIWLMSGANFQTTRYGSGDGFVWITSRNFTIISCYLTPSDPIHTFQAKLDCIEDAALAIGGNLIIAGDLNAKASEWGMSTTNSRGRRILDMSARLGLVVANQGTTTTFRRPGCEGTTPDITLASESLIRNLKEWKVIEDYTGSDHQYITYHIVTSTAINSTSSRKGTRRWNVSKLRPMDLITELDSAFSLQPRMNDAQSRVGGTMAAITRACEASMPKIGGKVSRKGAYWWSEEIRQLRQLCLHQRRMYTRARRNGPANELAQEYKVARRNLKMAILASKKRKWEELRTDINRDPWGLGYKLVMKKLGGIAAPIDLSARSLEKIVNTLFPTHELENTGTTTHRNEPVTLFTESELVAAVKTFKNQKAPGPDGIPAETLKIIVKERPRIMLEMYNECLMEGIFPDVWKIQRLVLIGKGKGDPESASSYRPLCMLDTAGKLLEKLIKPRLMQAVTESGGLSDRQYGFRRGRSTVDAIAEVLKSVELAQSGNHHSRQIVLLATLDVRNAFNSARWADIIAALESRFRVPQYLMRMIRSYLKNRILMYETENGMVRKQVTAGAAQGSILGPDLWNIMYDEILCIDMPEDSYLVGYADDIAAVITARDTEAAQRKLNQVMIRAQAWMFEHGLSLAAEKTELIVLTRKHIPIEIPIHIVDNTLQSRKTIKYLGLHLDSKLSYWSQINHAAAKAGKVTAALSRLMANIGGPTANKRKLLLTTVQSVLLYGSEIWADSLKAEYRRKALGAVQRTAALRAVSAYRTVSEAAVLVIGSSIPIGLLATERKKRWDQKHWTEGRLTTRELRGQSIEQWQQMWQNQTHGRWTARLIPNLTVWVDRAFGEVNYYLTQLLSGHGYFRKYLYRIGKCDSPCCIYGDAELDDAEHTFFECCKWQQERARIEASYGPLTAQNVIGIMLESEESWKRIANFVEDTLRKKKVDLEALENRVVERR